MPEARSGSISCVLRHRAEPKKNPRRGEGSSNSTVLVLLVGQRPDQHDHLAAFHLREVLDAPMFFGVFCHTLQQLAAQVLVRHLSAPKTQGDFHLVAVLQELEDVAHLDVIVIGIGVGPKLDLFDLNDLLLFAGLGLTLLLFVFELAKIHDLADGGIGVGRDLNQIKPRLICHIKGTRGRYNADIFAVGTNQADFRGADVLINTRAGISLGRRVVGSASDGVGPLMVHKS